MRGNQNGNWLSYPANTFSGLRPCSFATQAFTWFALNVILLFCMLVLLMPLMSFKRAMPVTFTNKKPPQLFHPIGWVTIKTVTGCHIRSLRLRPYSFAAQAFAWFALNVIILSLGLTCNSLWKYQALSSTEKNKKPPQLSHPIQMSSIKTVTGCHIRTIRFPDLDPIVLRRRLSPGLPFRFKLSW
jgi:hypothetical protein